MAQRISPTTVNITHVTKKGECLVNITLDLNINLSSDEINISSKKSGSQAIQQDDESKIADFEWSIPDFSGDEKISFGKDVE